MSIARRLTQRRHLPLRRHCGMIFRSPLTVLRAIGGTMHFSTITLDEKSSTSPTLASSGDRLFLAWTGSDTRLNVMSSTDGRRFIDKTRLDQRSYRIETRSASSTSSGFSETETIPLAPSLAASPEGADLGWTGSDGRLNVLRTRPGRSPAHTVLPETSGVAPALAPVDGDVGLAWTGTDRRLNIAVSRNSVFPAPLSLDEHSFHAPALCSVDGELLLAWTGSDRRLNVLFSRGGTFGDPLVLDQKSQAGPAVAVLGGEIALAWTGTDRHLNLIVSERRSFGDAVRLEAKSYHAPAVCAHGGQLHLVWTGSDRRLNVAPLAGFGR